MNEQMNNTGRGYLRVIVRAAREAFPIPGALVLVHNSDREGDNTDVLYSIRTDADGITEVVELAAPPAAQSMMPGDPAPFGRYNITIQKEGYGTVENVGVPIFDGIISTQPVQLIPLSEFETPAESETRIFESSSGEHPLV